jgi:hypothetical protein
MMTRSERAALQEARLRAQRDALDKPIARAQAIQREDARKQRDRRRYLVGRLCDEAGLLTWSDAELRAVIEALASLRDTPHPAEVLVGLVRERKAFGVITFSHTEG